MTDEGFEVIAATNGYEALKIIDAESPDLVLLDLMLPGLDGIEVCKRIRAESQVPIIMVTARVEEIDRLLELAGQPVGLRILKVTTGTPPLIRVMLHSPRQLDESHVDALKRLISERIGGDVLLEAQLNLRR